MPKSEWTAVAYIMGDEALPNLRDDFSFDLGGVELTRNAGWTTSSQLISRLGIFDDRVVRNASFVFKTLYSVTDSHNFQVDEPDLSSHQPALESIAKANTALWLAKPSPIAYRTVLLFRQIEGTWRVATRASIGHLAVHADDGGNVVSVADLEVARGLFTEIRKVPVTGPIHPALGLLGRALRESTDWDIRYLTLWVAIEALFGPEDAREIRYRLAYRLARFLEPTDPEEARKIFRKALKGYDIRSSIAHGMRVKEKDVSGTKADAHLHDIERWLSSSLRLLLTDANIRGKFHGKSRETYLDELVFEAYESRVRQSSSPGIPPSAT